MPKKDRILNLPGFTVKKVSGIGPMMIDVVYRRTVRCIHCHHKKLRKKDSFIRLIRHESIGLRKVFLRLKAYKFYCPACQRYFNQRFPGILKYQRSTEKLKSQVFHYHNQGVSQKDLACDLSLGKSTIERWYHQGYVKLNQHLLNTPCPQLLGIDEHSFSQKQGYATTLCNLRKNKVFDVVKGRSAASLAHYFEQLPDKEKVKLICMDLSASYRSLVKKYFPQAKIVADRFHVIRLLNHLSLKTYQSLDPVMKYDRGLLAALRTNPENLSEKRLKKRNDYLNHHPAINAIYQFKQRLHQLLMHKECTAKRCRKLIPRLLRLIHQLKSSGFTHLQTLGKTLYQWHEEIVRMWRFTKNNGITEGFHRKMKLIQRRAYGFRNFDNYRLRVRVLCS